MKPLCSAVGTVFSQCGQNEMFEVTVTRVKPVWTVKSFEAAAIWSIRTVYSNSK